MGTALQRALWIGVGNTPSSRHARRLLRAGTCLKSARRSWSSSASCLAVGASTPTSECSTLRSHNTPLHTTTITTTTPPTPVHMMNAFIAMPGAVTKRSRNHSKHNTSRGMPEVSITAGEVVEALVPEDAGRGPSRPGMCCTGARPALPSLLPLPLRNNSTCQLHCQQVVDTAPECIALSLNGCPRPHHQRCGERESFAACRRVQRAKQPCPGAASRPSRRRRAASFPQVPLTAEGGIDFYAAPDRVLGFGPSCPAGSSGGQAPRRRLRGSRRARGPGMDSQHSHRMVRPRAAILSLALLHFCVMAARVAADSTEPSALDLRWTPSDSPARQIFPTQPQVRWPQRREFAPATCGAKFRPTLRGHSAF